MEFCPSSPAGESTESADPSMVIVPVPKGIIGIHILNRKQAPYIEYLIYGIRAIMIERPKGRGFKIVSVPAPWIRMSIMLLIQLISLMYWWSIIWVPQMIEMAKVSWAMLSWKEDVLTQICGRTVMVPWCLIKGNGFLVFLTDRIHCINSGTSSSRDFVNIFQERSNIWYNCRNWAALVTTCLVYLVFTRAREVNWMGIWWRLLPLHPFAYHHSFS